MVYPCIVPHPFCTIVHSVHRAIQLQGCFENILLTKDGIQVIHIIFNIIKIILI